MNPTQTIRETAPVRIVGVGVGAIGRLALEEAQSRPDIVVAGAVDPLKVGERVGDVEILGQLSDVGGAADVAVLATGSSLPAVAEQIEAAAEAGLCVVSTCEELTYPWLRHPDVAERLDGVARSNDVAVLGCGVNPGFVMDVLPAHLAGASSGVTSLTVTRQVNLGQRRPQLQQKVGVGLPAGEWMERAAAGGFGHVGLVESAHLCALALRWEVGAVEFAREPVVREGSVVGIRETASASDAQNRTVSLTLVFKVVGGDLDVIEVEGKPNLELRVEGGVHGDAATVACMFHAAKVVRSMPAGLRLPIEAPAWAPPRRG